MVPGVGIEPRSVLGIAGCTNVLSRSPFLGPARSSDKAVWRLGRAPAFQGRNSVAAVNEEVTMPTGRMTMASTVCGLPESNLSCEECSESRPTAGLQLCQNGIEQRPAVRCRVSHELGVERRKDLWTMRRFVVEVVTLGSVLRCRSQSALQILLGYLFY